MLTSETRTIMLRLADDYDKLADRAARRGRTDCMCQSCVEIDKQIEHYRELLRPTRDQKEIERMSRMIAKLYGDRVLLHRNPER
jgi:hypothetical protein